MQQKNKTASKDSILIEGFMNKDVKFYEPVLQPQLSHKTSSVSASGL